MQIVPQREQLAEQFLVGELGSIGQVLAAAPLVVFKVGGEPLIAGKIRLRLVPGRLNFRVCRLLGLGARLALCRRAGPGVGHAGAALSASSWIGGLVLR